MKALANITAWTIALVAFTYAKPAYAGMIGINVLLNQPPSDAILADLAALGQVLDVIPEINAVTLRASEPELANIRFRSYVAAANPDAMRYKALAEGMPPNLSAGANQWSLDAINVTDFGNLRTVGYDGEGVYVAVIDGGFPNNWRNYLPEERIATQYARSFAGGGGEVGSVSAQPNLWEHSRDHHGLGVASVILGFRYLWAEPALPEFFNGVAPKATIIPINVFNNRDFHWGSVIAHAIVYVTELKTSGALGNAPLVINLSNGGPEVDLLELAAIDYAIAHGIVVVACAGNEAEAGMRFPGRYAPVISAAATAWVGTFQPKGSNLIDWIQNDIPEADATEHLIATFSAWELPGQDLDVAAPGAAVPVPGAHAANGQIDYDFVAGTSFASPHVAGIAALMLQKNPSLTASQIESILENTAMAIPSSCRDVLIPAVGPGNPPSWSDLSNVALLDVNICWEANVTGAGLVQADAALAATPLP